MCVDNLWQVSLDIIGKETLLLATAGRQEILRARFWGRPAPRHALIWFLEGLALWCGTRLYVVIFAAKLVHPTLGLGNDSDEWPSENPLLEFLFVERPGYDRHYDQERSR
jgi:hypothetical protein